MATPASDDTEENPKLKPCDGGAAGGGVLASWCRDSPAPAGVGRGRIAVSGDP
jgi:hypothetical protein